MERSGIQRTAFATAVFAATCSSRFRWCSAFSQTGTRLSIRLVISAPIWRFCSLAGGLVLLAIPLSGSTACWPSRSAWLRCGRRCRRLPFPGQVNAAASTQAGERAVYRLLQLNLLYDNRDARTGAVADRPGTARRDHPRTRFRPHGSRGCKQISAMYPFPDVCDASGWMRRRGDPVASADSPSAGRQMSRRAAPGNGADRLSAATGWRSRRCIWDWPWPFKQAAPARRPRPTRSAGSADGAACRRPQRRDMERRRAADRSRFRARPRRRDRTKLARPPAARRAAALCRPADRPGLRQGRHRDPVGKDARSRRLRPSAGAGRILAARRGSAGRKCGDGDSVE